MAWLGASCAIFSSAPTPSPTQSLSRGLARGFTLLLLHGGEIFKGECAHRGSPECISLHDGFQSRSTERRASKLLNNPQKFIDLKKKNPEVVW